MALQLVPTNIQCAITPIPPSLGMPEGAVLMLFMDADSGIQIPIQIPRLMAAHLANQMLACSKVGEGNGSVFPPAEPVYGNEDISE